METDDPTRTSRVAMNLPRLVLELVPQLSQYDWKGESRADCDRCVMLAKYSGAPPDVKGTFHPDARCCTYDPWLPNYTVGRILKAGGEGAKRMRKRLAEGARVTSVGSHPNDSPQPSGVGESFGRNLSQVCPFFTGDVAACAIWPDRNALCRTWFCKHDRGRIGQRRWVLLRRVLKAAEILVARYLTLSLTPPNADAVVTDYESWFLTCADQLNDVSPADLTECDDVNEERIALGQAHAWLNKLLKSAEASIPRVVFPIIAEHHSLETGINLFGYSPYDGVAVDPSILRFFVELDGERTWQEAVSRAASAGLEISTDVVGELFRVGVLLDIEVARERLSLDDSDPTVGGDGDVDMESFLQIEVRHPIVSENTAWLQSASTLKSAIIPTEMFCFISKLDDMPWGKALEEARDEVAQPLERDLVLRLCRIGILLEE